MKNIKELFVALFFFITGALFWYTVLHFIIKYW